MQAEGLSLDPNTDIKTRHGSVPIIPVLVRRGQEEPRGVFIVSLPMSELQVQ